MEAYGRPVVSTSHHEQSADIQGWHATLGEVAAHIEKHNALLDGAVSRAYGEGSMTPQPAQQNLTCAGAVHQVNDKISTIMRLLDEQYKLLDRLRKIV